MNTYFPYQYKNQTMMITQYLLLGRECYETDTYSIFDLQFPIYAKNHLSELKTKGYSSFELFFEKHPLGHSIFRNESEAPQRVYLCAEVLSKKASKIIVQVGGTRETKLWLNEKFLSLHNYDWMQTYYLTAELKKGENTFVFELYTQANETLFSLKLLDCQLETSNDWRALTQVGSNVVLDPLILVRDSIINTTSSKERLMVIKNGAPQDAPCEFQITDSCMGVVKSIPSHLNEVVTLDLDGLRELCPEQFRHEWIGCTYKDSDGKVWNAGATLVVTDFSERAKEIAEKALSCSEMAPPEIAETIIGRVRRQVQCLQHGDMISLFGYTCQVDDYTKELERGEVPPDFYACPGVREVFYHSNLDDSTVRMVIRVPKEYDPEKAHPVMFALSTEKDEGYCFGPIEELVKEPCIWVDVTGRGFTGGSYVGEASTMEIIRWVKERFHIDEDRVYLLGNSNGGYATYSIAQTHPHMAAAIYPHVGYPYVETVGNLSNTPVYQTVSPQDHVFAGHENEVKRLLSQYGNYHQIDFRDMTHNDFVPYYHHKGILNAMLQAKRDRYPNRIIYSTERNRYLESFWIRLHGIAKGKLRAKIKAEVIDSHTITVALTGSDGITITIPPQIDRKDFTVIINKTSFKFHDYVDKSIIFRKNKNWVVAEKEPPIDYRKGTGLLDVYLDSLRLIVPKNSEDCLREIASHFARPNTNGVDPRVYVDYPIYEDDNVPKHILQYNLILFDIGNQNEYVRRFADKLMIRYDKAGYEYKGNRVEGEYLLLQVIPNPYNPKRSITIVSMNDTKFSRNLFVRKVILPYYHSGMHPYWNNEALIFDGKQYSGVYETGGDIKPI